MATRAPSPLAGNPTLTLLARNGGVLPSARSPQKKVRITNAPGGPQPFGELGGAADASKTVLGS